MADIPKDEVLQMYFQGLKFHPEQKDAVQIYKELRVHVLGDRPDALIAERRPNEDQKSYDYRLKAWQPVTSIAPLRVIDTYGSIRRSNDWNVEYPANENKKIVESETLEYYCTKAFPIYGTVEQFIFSEYLNAMIVDPNCYIVVMPLNFIRNGTNEYYKPVPVIVNCDRVLHPPEKGDYFIFKSTDKVDLLADDGLLYETGINKGDVFYIITPTEIRRYYQTSLGGRFVYETYNNPTGKIPAFKPRAVSKEQRDSYVLQTSRIGRMLPDLNIAAGLFSDLQIVRVKCGYPDEWRYEDDPCPACDGGGIVVNPNTSSEVVLPGITCSKCGGSGHRFSPFGYIRVTPASSGETPAVTPPGGFIERDIESMVELKKSFYEHMFNSLEAMNMASLNANQPATSGEEKRMTSEPRQNNIYNAAEDVVWGDDQIHYWICEWRHFIHEPNLLKRQEMLPNIPVPEDFDMLPVNYLLDQIATAKQGGVSADLVAVLESNAAAKMFYNKPSLSKKISAIFTLNPLPGNKPEQISQKLLDKSITLEDAVIASYISLFVTQAMEQDKLFLGKPMEQQMEVIRKMAQEKMKENEDASNEAMLKQQQAQKALGMNTDPVNVPGGEKQQQEKAA